MGLPAASTNLALIRMFVKGLYTFLFALFVKITVEARRPSPALSAKVWRCLYDNLVMALMRFPKIVTLVALAMYILTVIYMGMSASLLDRPPRSEVF